MIRKGPNMSKMGLNLTTWVMQFGDLVNLGQMNELVIFINLRIYLTWVILVNLRIYPT